MVFNWPVLRAIPFWKKPYHIARYNFARLWLKFFPGVEIIGVTGSVGKTTTKEAIAQVLGEKFRVKKSFANLDPVFNIPKTILQVRPGDEKLVLEMGVEYPGEMVFYLSLARPQIAVVTQVAWTHTEFFGDIAGVIQEKKKLIATLPPQGWAVLNWDDPQIRKMAKFCRAKIFKYGINSRDCQILVQDIKSCGFQGYSFTLKNNSETAVINWSLLGRHNLYAALAAASVGVISGMTLEEIKSGLEKMTPQPSRLNVISGPNGSVIIDDSYNANPLATMAALETLVELPGKRKIAVLGEMRELGDYAEEGHRLVGKKVAQLGIDYLFTLGELTKFIVETAQESGLSGRKIFFAKDFSGLPPKLKELLKSDDVVLIKGSRATHLEKIVTQLT